MSNIGQATHLSMLFRYETPQIELSIIEARYIRRDYLNGCVYL